jgi:hypothetical protein
MTKTSIAFTAALLLAAVTLPSAAEARTGSDARCQGPDRELLVCPDVEVVPAYDNAWIGVDEGLPVDVDYPESQTWNIPQSDPDQCRNNTIIWGTADYPHTFAYMWQWDFWVEGGAWVLWDGLTETYPIAGVLSTGYGWTTMKAGLGNWNVYDDLKVRVFWVCAPAGSPTGLADIDPGKAPTAPAPGLHRGGDQDDNSLQGDEQPNALAGLGGDDRLSGGDGEDHLHAGAGDDSLSGGGHDDLLHAHTGDDAASGGSGVDDILTGKGDDVSKGGPGGDQLFDDQGSDHLRGGPGNDRFSAHDGDRDRIDCGPGEDIALIDKQDVAIDCEHAYRTAREAPKRLPKI